MNKTRKLASLLLALVMVLGMVGGAMAATVDNNTTHSYDAYQIFSGTQAEKDASLGDVVWGSGVNGETLLAALKDANEYFDSCATAADVANVLAGKADGCDEALALAAIATKHLTSTKVAIAANASEVDLPAGYYLLVDTSTPAIGDAKNSALLQVTNKGAITIDVKYDAPEVDKTVSDVNTNIGDVVTFTLTATMPSNLEGYETYKVVFHDTLSAGLTYANNLKVTIDGADKTGAFNAVHNNGQLTVSCTDVLAQGAHESSKIVVTYDATVNSNAIIGNPGNPNSVKLQYSNDPNWDGKGTEPTGETPEDVVHVFTFELDVTKIDGSTNAALADAEFVLYREVTKNGETVKEYVLVDESGKVTGWTESIPTPGNLKSDDKGLFKVIGLEAGNYFLKETKAPKGYNLIKDPIAIEIIATFNETSKDDPDIASVATLKIKVGSTEADGNVGTGIVATSVKNNKGATLPETGGMGTTLLYIAGSILVVGAFVLMITKRRVSTEK